MTTLSKIRCKLNEKRWEDQEKENGLKEEYIKKIYAGWLGKMIGIRHGALIEGWTYDQIRQKYGEIDGYITHYDGKLFAADDDSNGSVFFPAPFRIRNTGRNWMKKM